VIRFAGIKLDYSGNSLAVMTYAFDNAAPQADGRFTALTAIFDPGTIRHLRELGIGAGWRCLEVGAGGGSVASWLSEQVGAAGRVIATDIDVRFLERLQKSNLEVWRHDIASDPLPEATFDVIHLRLVLGHLPNREDVIARLVAALRPGGWLLAEEFDSHSMRADRATNIAETALKSHGAMQDVLARHGFEGYFGRRLMGRLLAHGLSGVTAEGRVFMFQGGTSGAELTRAAISQARDEMITLDAVTAAEVEYDLAQLRREDFMMPSPVMWAVRGRKPT
jgi:SAM-dependent methyltransferase